MAKIIVLKNCVYAHTLTYKLIHTLTGHFLQMQIFYPHFTVTFRVIYKYGTFI